MTRQRMVAAVALFVAAAAIAVQKAAGAEYPLVPPGLLILAAAGLVCVLWRRWWAPLIAVAVVAFLGVGAVLAPNTSDNLGEPAGSAVFLGTVLQLAAMAAGLIAAVLTSVRERR
jgi:hypothetical protein